MTMRSACVAVAGLGLLLTAVPSQAGELECKSKGHRYRYCPADTRNSVQLAQQTSSSACRFGSS